MCILTGILVNVTKPFGYTQENEFSRQYQQGDWRGRRPPNAGWRRRGRLASYRPVVLKHIRNYSHCAAVF